MENEIIKNWIGILVFKINSVEFGFNIMQVHVLNNVQNKNENCGFILYNNRKVPMYNIEEYFNIQSSNGDGHSNALLFESDEGTVCFGIDQIIEVLPLSSKIIENEFTVEKTSGNSYSIARIYFEGRPILVPNLAKIAGHISYLKQKGVEQVY